MLHTALGVLQATLGGVAEGSSSAAAAGAGPKAGHQDYERLL